MKNNGFQRGVGIEKKNGLQSSEATCIIACHADQLKVDIINLQEICTLGGQFGTLRGQHYGRGGPMVLY